MRVRFLNVGGVETRVATAGDGPPVILLHGVGLSADTFFLNLDALGREMTAIAVDMLGHGFTDCVDYDGGAPHPRLVDHVLAVADSLGLERFAVAGSSFGAQIATLMHLRHPERVRGLSIIGSGSSFNSEEELLESLDTLRENALKALRDPTWKSCMTRLRNIVYDPKAVPRELILSQLTSYARPGVRAAYEATLEGMMNMNLARPHRILEKLEQISCPTLIVWGKQDIRGKYERAVEAQRRIRDSEIVAFDECGHLPYIEHPEEFNEAFTGYFHRHLARVLS